MSRKTLYFSLVSRLPAGFAGLDAGTRLYHSSHFHKTINTLYKNKSGWRYCPVSFDETPIDGFSNLRDKKAVKEFLSKFKNKGGIYKFTLINKPNIFYIGSTPSFNHRFRKHTARNALLFHYDWFHWIAKQCGWDKFKFEILEEIKDLSTLRKRENFYLTKYYPLLNTLYKSGIVIHKNPKTPVKDWLKISGYRDYK